MIIGTYFIIVSYNKDEKTYKYISFQKDKYGDITVVLKNTYSNNDGTPGADISITSQIPIEEYENKKETLLAEFFLKCK